MAYRAIFVSKDPLNYFLQPNNETSYLRVSDVVVRANYAPNELFSGFIRLATNSQWSHSSLLYLISDPPRGFDNTFLVEALTTGVRVASWRNEVVPFTQFTVGLKRPRLDWYVETPQETSKRDPDDHEDLPGIDYLRHVRGMAIDQISNLYDHKIVWELTAMYIERVAQQRLSAIPEIAEAAAWAANFFKHWDEASTGVDNMLHFICSGLVQYSFFAALRVRIINDMAIPAHRDAAMSNLSNLHRVIFRDDPQQIMPNYIRQVQTGKVKLSDPIPGDVLNLLRTATPADFNDSPNLEWRYIINKGMVWQIHDAPDNYTPASQDETNVLALMHKTKW